MDEIRIFGKTCVKSKFLGLPDELVIVVFWSIFNPNALNISIDVSPVRNVKDTLGINNFSLFKPISDTSVSTPIIGLPGVCIGSLIYPNTSIIVVCKFQTLELAPPKFT